MTAVDEFLGEYTLKLKGVASGLAALNIEVSGIPLELKAENGHLQYLKFQLGHLEVNQGANSTDAFIEFSAALSLPFRLTRDFERFGSRSIRYLRNFETLVISDEMTNEHFVLYRNGRRPESADALRLLLQIFLKTGAVPIHGGSISWGSQAALISNVGGSGKSTLISAAVAFGATTTGDDFGLLELDLHVARVWSQFRTFKVGEESPSFSLASGDGVETAGPKRSFSFESISPGKVVPYHAINVILIPKLSAEFQITRTTPRFAFSRIAPSSAGMAVERQRTCLKIMELCERVPAFELELTQNLAQDVKTVREFLAS